MNRAKRADKEANSRLSASAATLAIGNRIQVGRRRSSRSRSSLSIVIAVAFFLGCAAERGSANSDKYALYEMRMESVRLAFSPSNSDDFLAWLDDSRVLFEGFDALSSAQERIESGQERRPLRALFVWNIHTGKVTRHTKESLQSSMCFADGFVSYVVDRKGTLARLSGPFGEEHDMGSPRHQSNGDQEFGRFTCAYYRRVDMPPGKFGGVTYPLRMGDGWIERIPGGAWVYPATGAPRKLSIPTLTPGSIYPHKHSSYAKKYLYFHSNRTRSETWAFSTAGEIEILRFPDGPWEDGHIEPARPGLLLRSKKVSNKIAWDPGYAGLYLHSQTGQVEKLAPGNVYAMRVSNNGCLIAAFIDPWDSYNRKHRLIALDLCRKGKGHVG